MSIHIAFVKSATARFILNGSQTCESRLSKVRHPARNVAAGDTLLFKSGNGVALATVSRVETYESLTALDIETLRELYANAVDGPQPDSAYWEAKRDSHHAVFMWLSNVRAVYVPAKLLPSTQSAWVQNYQPTPEVLGYLKADGSDLHRQPSCWKQDALLLAPHPH